MTRQSEMERRHARDRRRFARGGRRPYDRDGYAPLILVADDDADSTSHCEAILAALRFAVAPAHSVEEAQARHSRKHSQSVDGSQATTRETDAPHDHES